MNFKLIRKKLTANFKLILNIYILFLIFITILFSRNTLITTCVVGFNKSFFISILLYIPLLIIFMIKLVKAKIQFKNIKIVIVMIATIIISVLIKKDWQLYNISILYYITMSTILILMADFNQLKNYYINILLFLAIFSLLTTYVVKPLIFTCNLENEIMNSKLIVTNSVGYKFLNLFFGFALFNQEYDRNYGIFTEPSYYQFYLIIAIIMILFSKEKKVKDWIKIAILSYTIYTTKSAAGFVVFSITICTYIINYFIINRRERKKLYFLVISFLVLIIVLMAITDVKDTMLFIYNKFTTKNDSSLSRFGSITYTINNFSKSPIIGNKISDILSYENHLTNTTIAIGAIYGVIPFICVIYFSWKFAKRFDLIKVIQFLIMCIIIMSYNSHVFIGVQSFWLIILLGVSKKNEDDCENNKLMSNTHIVKEGKE